MLKSLLTERTELDADLLYYSMKGLGTDDDCLIELICTRSPVELKYMFDKFRGKYKKDPVTWISDETSGSYKKVLQKVIETSLNGDRMKMPTKEEWEPSLIKHVKSLYDAGEGQIGTDDKVFIELIAGKPREYVEKLSDYYCKKHGKYMETVISDECSFNFKKALIALVTPLPEWYADRLYKTMKGVGTEDLALVRIVATQKNRLLRPIAATFLHKYRSTLRTWIRDDTSGQYCKILEMTVMNYGEERLIPKDPTKDGTGAGAIPGSPNQYPWLPNFAPAPGATAPATAAAPATASQAPSAYNAGGNPAYGGGYQPYYQQQYRDPRAQLPHPFAQQGYNNQPGYRASPYPF